MAAYVGLPILYAAYNTFAPVHDLILGGLSIASGAAVGSPLDVSDSLMIPIGLGIALWVWRRPVTSPKRLRLQLAMALVVVGAVASIASSGTPPSPTEWQVGVARDGAVIVEAPFNRYYRSSDGGETWSGPTSVDREAIEWGLAEIRTSRGTYRLDGSEITLTRAAGERKRVYSYGYLRREDNKWAQAYGTRHRRFDLTGIYEDPERHVITEPVNMVIDVGTGNVIVAMGMQGVLVGDEQGNWRGVAVGGFAPIDFSFLGKARLLSSFEFWVGVVAFCVLFLVVVLALVQPGRGLPAFFIGASPAKYRWITVVLILALPFWVLGVSTGVLDVFGVVLIFNSLLFYWITMGSLVAFAWSWRGESLVRKSMAVLFGLLAAISAFQSFPPFSTESDLREEVLVSIGLMFSLMAVAIYPPLLRQLKAYLIALAAMVAAIVLPLVLWLMGVLIIVAASAASVVILLLVSYALFKYLYYLDSVPRGPVMGPTQGQQFRPTSRMDRI